MYILADAITTKNITSVDEVQSVDNTDKVFVNDNGEFKQVSISNLMKRAPAGITQETDPTVSEWAKQPTKPSYTADEVGAQPALNISDKTGSDTSYTQEVKRDASTNKLLVPASGGTVDPEQIEQAVNGYLEENPVSGMTAEQEQQLNQNTTYVADLKSALEELKKNLPSGITPNASSLLITILRSGVFNSDQSSNITELEKELQGNGSEEGGGEEGGGIDENVKYGIHNDLGYTGKLETGLATSTTSRLNIDKIVLDIDIKTDTIPTTGSYILISYFITDLRINASGKWTFAGSEANVIADKTPDDVMGNGRTTITFSNLTGVVESNQNEWRLIRGNAQETPEAIWYNVKFYSGDTLKADLTPTSKLGDMYDSVSGKTRSFSEIDGLELVEVK